MSSNLPPGVSVNMIPGNRPEDLREEGFWEAFLDEVDRHQIVVPNSVDPDSWDDPRHWLSRMIVIARDIGYNEGMADGRAEEQMSRMAEECIRCGYAHSVQSPCVVD